MTWTIHERDDFWERAFLVALSQPWSSSERDAVARAARIADEAWRAREERTKEGSRR